MGFLSGILDSITGGFGGIVGSLVSGFLGQEGAEDRQADSQQFSAEQYAKRYQTTVSDMKAAGLNPMLAYGAGAVSGQPSSSAASANNFPDIGQHMTQSRINSAQIANLEADTENKAAQGELMEAQAAAAWASANQSDANRELIAANVRRLDEEIKTIPVERDRVRAAIRMLDSQAFKMRQEGLTEPVIRGNLMQTMQKMSIDMDISRFVRDAKQASGNMGNIMKEGDVIWKALDSINRMNSGTTTIDEYKYPSGTTRTRTTNRR